MTLSQARKLKEILFEHHRGFVQILTAVCPKLEDTGTNEAFYQALQDWGNAGLRKKEKE